MNIAITLLYLSLSYLLRRSYYDTEACTRGTTEAKVPIAANRNAANYNPKHKTSEPQRPKAINSIHLKPAFA